MNTTTMPSVGLQMDFSKDAKAMVRSDVNPQDSDFLKQIRSATEVLQKQTTEVKKQADKASTKSETTVKSKDTSQSEKSEDTDNNSNDKTATMAELARMLIPQEIPMVVDVKEMLLSSESEQNGVVALGELPSIAVNNNMANGSVVGLEQLQDNQSPVVQVGTEGQEANEQFVLAGQQQIAKGDSEALSDTKTAEKTPQTAIPMAEVATQAKDTKATEKPIILPNTNEASTKNTSEVKVQEQPTTAQKPAENTELTEAATDIAGDELTEKPKATTENPAFKEALEKAEVTDIKVAKQTPTNQSQNEQGEQSDESDKGFDNTNKEATTKSRANSDESKELFVTDKFRKQMDKLEEMLQRSGMTTAQIKDFKTLEQAKVANIENLDMAPQVQQVTGKIFEAMENGTNELIMQLQPKELGKLMIKLSMENNRLTVNITAENMHAQKAITEQLGLLESSIKSQNVILDRINVTYESANNMNSSYNNSGLGGQFEGQERNAQHSQNYQNRYGIGEDIAEDSIEKPKLMIIGNDMLNYVV